MDDPRSTDGPRRRTLLMALTVAMGGAIGAILGVPLVSYLVYPLGKKIVSSPEEPLEVLDADALVAGGPPVQVAVIATSQRDGWGVREGVAVGSAWVSKDDAGQVTALSGACPHLGCAIGFEPKADVFRCPCHKSEFRRDGEKMSGPSKRGLDPLPCQVEGKKVKLTFLRYQSDIADRIKV